jgi:hypothetical protein
VLDVVMNSWTERGGVGERDRERGRERERERERMCILTAAFQDPDGYIKSENLLFI